MEKEKIIRARAELQHIVDKNIELLEYEAAIIEVDNSIFASEEIKKSFDNIENEDRDLKIGIVGRVKAGKSSLLNALLFDGKDILPKAATPMTAALTEISYGETLSAEVDFFSNKDIEEIKKNAIQYRSELSNLVDAKTKEITDRKKKKGKPVVDTEIVEMATRQAKNELNKKIKLSASDDQFQRMKASGIDINSISNHNNIQAANIEQLGDKLLDFVGSKGKFMPFTKSVHIKLPIESLKGLQIVDTPGLNDPVQSREERTRQLLKFCDVIFIISPAGQFISREDTELMDRISTKEGVRELYVVSSQVDNQLMGNMKDEYNGVLPNVLDGITKTLGTHLKSTLSELKRSNPEIGTIFDELIDGSSDKIIYSSGICQSIKQKFDERDSWDDGLATVWNNLTRYYPDYFSDTDKELSFSNLDLLGNMQKVNSVIQNVSQEKDKIFNERKSKLINDTKNGLLIYQKKLIDYSEKQINKIKNTDTEELLQQKTKLSVIQEKATAELNEVYYELVQELSCELNSVLIATLRRSISRTEGEIKDSEELKTESYEVSSSDWWNPLSWGSTITKTRSFTSVMKGAVKTSLDDIIRRVKLDVSSESKKYLLAWKKKAMSKLSVVLKNNSADDCLDALIVSKTIREIIYSAKCPDLHYNSLADDLNENTTPSSVIFAFLSSFFSGSGTLTGNSAEQYIGKAQGVLSEFNSTVTHDIEQYSKDLENSLNNLKPSDKIFASFKKQIEELEKQLKTKAMSIAHFERIKKSLKAIQI